MRHLETSKEYVNHLLELPDMYRWSQWHIWALTVFDMSIKHLFLFFPQFSLFRKTFHFWPTMLYTKYYFICTLVSLTVCPMNLVTLCINMFHIYFESFFSISCIIGFLFVAVENEVFQIKAFWFLVYRQLSFFLKLVFLISFSCDKDWSRNIATSFKGR